MRDFETGTNPNIIGPILASLSQAIGGVATVGTLVHGSASGITTNLNGTPGFVTAVEPNSNTTGTPQAYLTILFFDERFNFISSADGGVAQAQVASTWTTGTVPLNLPNVKAPKNGYAFIYVSNRSDQDVYFDNMVVSVSAANIIEENHYYAFGLKIAAISSHKLQDVNEGKMSNPYQYNDKEMLDEDAGLNWYDYGFRNYDPQIGRFMQLDPMAFDYEGLTPFQFAGDDPVANVDLDGLEPITSVSNDFSYSYSASNSLAHSWNLSQLSSSIQTIKATETASKVSLSFNLIVSASGVFIHSALIASNAINGGINTGEVGKYSPNDQQKPHVQTNQEAKQAWDKWVKKLKIDYLNSLKNAENILGKKEVRLKRWNSSDKQDFKNHFGVDNENARNIIKTRVEKEIKLIKFKLSNKSEKFTFDFTYQNTYASVNPNDETHTVILGSSFESAPDVGIDSKAGTIVHELSHFDDVGHTSDENRTYGVPASKLLIPQTQKVLYHADSFEYYIEGAW